MESVYVKVGNRYKSIGLFTTDVLFDGLWLVQSHDHGKSSRNFIAKLSDLPNPVDVQDYMKAYLNKDTIIKAIQKLEKEKGLTFYNVSLNDFAEEIVDEVYKNDKRNEDD